MPSEKPKSPTRLTTNAFSAAALARRLVVPEADQQVGGEADAFPAEEHLHQVVGGHQHQHREAEQRQIGEEARLARVLLHVAPAVEVDEAGDGRDDDQHNRGQAVDAKRPVDIQRARLDPVEHRHDRRLGAARDVGEEDRPAEECADEQRAGRDDLGGGLADPAAEQARDDRGDERQEDDEEQGVHQPCIRLTSSTAIEPRRRKKMTRMARPIAASAAATVSTNIASTWPVRSPRIGREGDQVDVHREQDQLDRHQHQDDVAAIEEDAEHADREQDRGDGEIMAER